MRHHSEIAAAVLVGLCVCAPSRGGESADVSGSSQIDYLRAATDFADCMIRHGRDRYGSVHSPLFAVLLMRTSPPRIGPEPYFDRPCPYNTSNMTTPFRLHHYNRCLNYPKGLGSEGPHKVTLFGCDVQEDRDLYTMLIDLSRITGRAKYRDEALKALRWWFTHTMGPADLYPWGEHLGWDFVHECPTYFAGPSKYLYAACYHEIKDRVPFLDVLAALPVPAGGARTYLDRYALGVWNAHYWDHDRGIYCRHGDYTGQDKRTGSTAGFPAHQGAHLRLWVASYRRTKDAEVRRQMAHILNTVLDVQLTRTKRYGFVPFTFDPDLKGKSAGKRVPAQSIRLAYHAAELSLDLREYDPKIAAKLRELARLHLGEEKFRQWEKDFTKRRSDPMQSVIDWPSDPADGKKPAATVCNLSKAQTPAPHAKEILRRIGWWRRYGDKAYLAAAEAQARQAWGRFMDKQSPLPKAFSGPPRKTVAGKAFGSFTFRGAKLMHAFALLAEARRTAQASGR